MPIASAGWVMVMAVIEVGSEAANASAWNRWYASASSGVISSPGW